MILTDDTNRDGIALTGASDTLPEYIKGTPPSIETLRKRFKAARDDLNEKRIKCQQDRDYYDGPGQLDAIRAELKRRGQPEIYTNRIRPAVNGVLGVLENGKRDPRGMPRNPDDQDGADICTKTLRFINDESKFGDTQLDVAENFLIEGTGAVIIEMVDDQIVPTQIRWEEFYYDNRSRRPDFKDARYMGIAKWKDAEEIREQWAVSLKDIGDPMRPEATGSIFGDSFEDRGDGMGWVDLKRRRVLLVEEYAIEGGEWKRLVYIAAGVLEYGPSPWLDSKRRPCNPIEAVSCYVDRDNARYGMVRDMKPIQDEVNSSRSRSQHLMNSRQVQNVDMNAPPVDDEIVRREAVRADGVIPQGWQVLSSAEMTQANLLRMQEAKGEIERMGPTPAVLGRQEGAGQSGRARLVSQQAGLTELARPMGRLHGWVLRVYEQMWERARQFWTDPMWIRVTDEVKAPEFMKVNEPVMGPVMQAVAGPDGQPMIDPLTGQPQMMAGIGIVGYKNRLAELDMDIILDQDDDTVSMQQEVWGEIMQMVGQAGGLQIVFSPEFELMLEAAPLADKRRIIELIKAAREEKKQDVVAQMQKQIAQLTEALKAKQEKHEAVAAAEAENTQADTLSKLADAHKTATETDKGQAELYAGLGINPLVALTD